MQKIKQKIIIVYTHLWLSDWLTQEKTVLAKKILTQLSILLIKVIVISIILVQLKRL